MGLRIVAFAWMLIVWESYAIVSWTPTNLDGSGQLKGRDFPQFYAMGGLVRDGRAESLSDGRALSEWLRTEIPDAPRFTLQNVYGPQIALIFAPLARLPYARALVVWTIVSLLIYGAVCGLLIVCCGRLREHRLTVGLFAAGSPALMLSVLYGHLSVLGLLFAAVAYLALGSGRNVIAGLAIGMLCYKPPLALVLVLVFCIDRHWRVLAGVCLGILAQVAAAVSVAPVSVLLAYGRRLFALARDPTPVHSGNLAANQSLLGLFDLAFGSGVGASLAYACTALVAVGAAVSVWRSRARLEIRFSALVIATVLASPHFFVYDLVILVVPALLLLEVALDTTPAPQPLVLPIIVAVLYSVAPLGLAASLSLGVAVGPLALSGVLAFLAWHSIAGRLARTEAPG